MLKYCFVLLFWLLSSKTFFVKYFSSLLYLFTTSALEYLHNLSKDLETAEKSSAKRAQNGLDQSSGPTPRKPSGRGRGRKRKAPDYSSDQSNDEDFDPGNHGELESEEDEDEDDEDSVPWKQQCKVKMHSYFKAF